MSQRAVYDRRYQESAKGQARAARYAASKKGLARNVRYDETLKGTIRKAKYDRQRQLQEVQHALEAVR